jgi:hypothetical protein
MPSPSGSDGEHLPVMNNPLPPYKYGYFFHKKPLCAFVVSGMHLGKLSSILLRPFQGNQTIAFEHNGCDFRFYEI